MTETVSIQPRLLKRQNPAVEQYASLLIRLHERMRNGDEEGAEEIREQMDTPGLLLNEDEIKLVKCLSTDLYVLAGEEMVRPSGHTKSDYMAALADAVRSRDYLTVLASLRKKERPFTDDQVAFRRAIIYKWLGLKDASRQFLLMAAKLAPRDLSYRMSILNDLKDFSKAAEIEQLASETLEDANAQPEAIFNAAGALYFLTSGPTASNKRAYLGKARREIQRVFNTTLAGSLTPVSATFGLLILGGVLEALNRKSEAKNAYVKATEINPNESVPWVSLGTIWLQDNPPAAMPYYKRAVELKTTNPLPYLALAKEALEDGDYSECKRLSKQLLEIIEKDSVPEDVPALSAQVYEFLGLAEAEQNGPTEAALASLSEAARLSPGDDRIQKNYAEVLREAGSKEAQTVLSSAGRQRLSDWFEGFAENSMKDLKRSAPSTALFLSDFSRYAVDARHQAPLAA